MTTTEMSPAAETTPLIRAHELEYRYASDGPPVFEGLTVGFHAGRIAALTGPSGCGKSTLLYLLASLLTPTRGAVFVDDVAVSALSDHLRSGFRAAHFGFIFQDAMLDPSRPVIDSVCESAIIAGSSRAAARRRARSLLSDFGLAHRVGHRPGEISGGQAQRVAICRALAPRPDVIFADEPTGNLDPAAAHAVVDALRQVADTGAAVLIATHDPLVADRCDDVVRLDEINARSAEQTGRTLASSPGRAES